jgi:hypothetical protein
VILKSAIAIALLSSTPILLADQSTLPSFAKGFEMLNTLGPSPLDQGATWRKLDAGNMLNSKVLRQLTGSMQGNGWLLPSIDGTPNRSIPFGSAVPREIQIQGNPAQGDLEKDTATILEAIDKIERADDLDDFRRPWTDSGSRTFGPLMLFAAQLHQAGHPKLADQIAWALFQKAPNREVVVDAALDHLGTQLYQHATDRFFKNHDWQAYRDELTALIEKLPRGWDAQPAAMLVLESVNRRISQPTPPAPQLEQLPISPAAINAIAWMTTPPESNDATPSIPPEVAEMLAEVPPEYHAQVLARYGGGGGNRVSDPGFWLLDTNEEDGGKSSPARELLALGIEAIPVLAALTTDSYPTHLHNPSAGEQSFSYSRSAASRALETYAGMARPATRGDLAKTFLKPILPDGQDQLDDADNDTLRDIAIEFYQTHKGKDAAQFAAIYLAEGDENQKSLAVDFLINSTDPEHHRIFETHILDSSPATAHLTAVVTYAQLRKADAKPLIEKFLPLIRTEIGDGTNLENNRNLSWQFREPGQLKQTLRQLEAIAEGRSLTDSAREIATGPPEEAEAAIQALSQSLSTESPDQQLEILLAGALATENPQVRSSFLTPLFQYQSESDEEDAPAPPVITDTIRQAWTVLGADTRPIAPEWISNLPFPADDIASFAAMVLESRLHSGGLIELNQAAIILKQPIAKICMARIKARIANETLPALPNPENINEERLREIITTAATKSGTDILTYLDTLTPDERAAWAEWIAEPGEIKIPESVLALSSTIVTENTSPQQGLIPTPGLLNLKTGLQIDQNIDAYIATLAANSAEHSLAIGTLRQADFPPGLASWTLRAEFPKAEDEEETISRMGYTPIDLFRQLVAYFSIEGAPEKADALIICQLYSEASQGIFLWWVIEGKPSPFSVSDEGTLGAPPETTLTQTLAAARESGQAFMLNVQVLSREHAKKLAED